MSENQRLVLVTGANGFRRLAPGRALLARGYRVRCMVRRSSDLQFIEDLPVEWAYSDVEDASGVALACEGVDVICHCAALTRALEEETLLRVNAGATLQLARLALDANPGLKRFLFVSSMAAGPSAHAGDILDEASPPAPITWYGQSKLAAEEGLRGLADRLPVTIVRPVAVFGPRDRDFRVYFSMVKRGLALELGGGERAIPFIYIDDLIELLLRALESQKAEGETLFWDGEVASYAAFSPAVACGYGPAPNNRQAAGQSARGDGPLGQDPGTADRSSGASSRTANPGDAVHYWLYSGEKARQDLGYRTQVGLEEGVKGAADWYEKAGWIRWG